MTTPVEQVLYLTDDDVAYIKGKKVLLMDDVYGHGGTSKALKDLLAQAEAKCAGQAMVALETQDHLPEDLIYLFDLPSYTL